MKCMQEEFDLSEGIEECVKEDFDRSTLVSSKQKEEKWGSMDRGWWFVDWVVVVGRWSVYSFRLLGFSWWVLVTMVGLGCGHNGLAMGLVDLAMIVTCLWVDLAVVVRIWQCWVFFFFGLCSCWWLWLGCDVGVVSGRCGGFGSGCGFGDDWVVDLGVDFREEKDRERERENKK